MMEMTGADEADYLQMTEWSTRSIDFPDGVIRFVSLENFYWAILDWLLQERRISLRDFMIMAHTHAIQTPDMPPDGFEAQVPHSFRACLTVLRNGANEEDLSVANENSVHCWSFTDSR